MLDDEPEEVVVPRVNQGPDVASVEVLRPVEERPRRLDRNWGDLVLGGQVGHDVGQGAVESTLAVEGTLQLEERTVSFVGPLFRQGECLAASHGVVSAGVSQKARDLLDRQVSLVGHGTPAGRTMGQPRVAVVANKMSLDALLHRRRDVVQAHWTLEQG